MVTPAKKDSTVTVTTRPRTSSSDSYVPSVRTPRAARFAEATAVNSPIEPSQASRPPFADYPTNHYKPQPQPSDVGFGYLTENEASRHESYAEMEETDVRYLPPPIPGSPMRSPLKSAMKSPGTAPRNFENILSPTFKEEQTLEKQEEMTDKQQAKDLKVKTRVRMAKMMLRGVNFSCSLIVLSMLSVTFSIFNATKHLPPRNTLPAWAPKTQTWPQITLLCIACVSLAMSMIVFYAYWKGGHKRAEKVAVYYTTFAIAFFVFSIIMWGIGAGVLNQSKAQGNGKDLWGWSCLDNRRKELFANDVSYALICRLQNWSLVCCIIEVVVETITIAIYGVVFYRFYSKRQLRRSMAVRDRARSDLYLAQLRSQSAPNTPGFGPLSPRDGGWRAPVDAYAAAPALEDGNAAVQYADATPRPFAHPKPFALQPPPIKIHTATPRVQQGGFSPVTAQPPVPQAYPADTHDRVYEEVPIPAQHVPAAPGEVVYESVPIPGAYHSPLSSPSLAKQMSFPPHA
ncbi:hypothetical protein BJ546DRAFT_258493 [Cryomyces antarcticus]